MKKRGKLVLFTFGLLLSLLVVNLMTGVYGKNQARIDAAVSNEIQSTGKAKVIITLKDAKDLGLKYIFASSSSVREQAIGVLGNEKVKHKFNSFNGFSASINEEDLDRLRNDERIESIEYDIPMHAFLQDSTVIVNATNTWATQINGINLTGAGQTICILDTGVNYSHPDLGGCTIKNLSLQGNNESYILENSPHPYDNYTDITWTINYTGFEKIAVHFVNISTERAYDFITIYDGNNKTIATYSGNETTRTKWTDIWTPSVEGDTIYLRLKSDSSINDYGFYIDLVLNGTTNTTYNWSDCNKVIHGWDIYNNDPDPIDDNDDDNGHGTHVTGIAAANGAIKGVAPEAKIVSIKVLDNNGNGYGGDIVRGIEWCTENSEEYNISVISMSLGADCSSRPDLCYSDYCDNSYPTFSTNMYKNAINAAVTKNISVVVATGNNGNKTHISLPSCIQNATAVGWVGKNDIFHANSNRNSITDLVATGTGINSTQWTSGYTTMQGTSMSTPHVSAAFALIRQFYLLQSNIVLTPSEIQDALNDTGERIYDSGSGLYYSRINIYAAASSLNNPPNVTILSPENTTYDTLEILINLTNSSDALNLWWFNGTDNITYTEPGTFNFTYGSHTIYAYSNDTFNALGSTSITFSITNDTNIEFENPTTSGNVSQDYILVNVSSTDTSLDTILVYLYNASLDLINSSNSSTSPLFVNFSDLSEGTYYLNATANDTDGNQGATETRTINLDMTPPNLTMLSPTNGSWYNALRFNVSLNEPGSVCWAVYNSSNITLDSLTSTHFYHINSSAGGETSNNTERNVTMYCNDTAGNINNSTISFFGIDTTDPTVSLVAPADEYSTTETTITFSFNADDTHEISTCDLIIDSSSEYTWTDVDKGQDEDHAESGLSVASHDWRVDCIDEAGNIGSSSTWDFSVTDSGGTSGDGGDGDDSTSDDTTTSTGGADEDYEEVIYSITNDILKNGTSKRVREEDRFAFEVYNRSHSLTIMNVTSNSVRFRLRSDPIYFDLNVSENKSFDLNKDNYYDFFVQLNSITGIVANVTIQEIYVAYEGNYTLDLNETLTSGSEAEDAGWNWDLTWPSWLKWGWKTYLYIGIGIIVLGVAGVVGVILWKRRQKHLRLHGYI